MIPIRWKSECQMFWFVGMKVNVMTAIGDIIIEMYVLTVVVVCNVWIVVGVKFFGTSGDMVIVMHAMVVLVCDVRIVVAVLITGRMEVTYVGGTTANLRETTGLLGEVEGVARILVLVIGRNILEVTIGVVGVKFFGPLDVVASGDVVIVMHVMVVLVCDVRIVVAVLITGRMEVTYIG